MDPIRPSRGKARGRPQVPTNQPGVSSVSGFPPQGIRAPRPTSSQPCLIPMYPTRPILAPRPIMSQPIHSTQPLQAPILAPRPTMSHPIHTTQPILAPRPTISQPIHSTQPLQTPVTGVGMQRPPRQMPPRPSGAPQQRAPRPIGPKPGISSDRSTDPPRQDPMAGVRIYLNLYTMYMHHLYDNFFSRCNKLQKDLKIWVPVIYL